MSYANGSKSDQSALVNFLVAFHGSCVGFEGVSTLPITGCVGNKGDDVNADEVETVPSKLGWARGK